jgi:plasmid stabilization system protein ParE
MNCRFQPVAEAELDAAAHYYKLIRPQLAIRFIHEAQLTLTKISEYPRAWHPTSKRTRACRIGKFPYTMVYQIIRNEIEIVAVSHLSRDQSYWKNRLKK